MAVDPRQMILQMMMRGGGAGGMPGVGMAPPVPEEDVEMGRDQYNQTMLNNQSSPQDAAFATDMNMNPGKADLPPEVMKLASLGIGPGDLQQGRAQQRPPVHRAGGPDDVDPMEAYGAPGDEEDPRFGPQEDPVRDETEGELAANHKEMMGEDEDSDFVDWEGDKTPSEADLNYIKEHPSDGNLASFFKAFPTWTAEDILMQGGNPSESPDQYAMSDDEWEETQKDRSTRIDER